MEESQQMTDRLSVREDRGGWPTSRITGGTHIVRCRRLRAHVRGRRGRCWPGRKALRSLWLLCLRCFTCGVVRGARTRRPRHRVTPRAGVRGAIPPADRFARDKRATSSSGGGRFWNLLDVPRTATRLIATAGLATEPRIDPVSGWLSAAPGGVSGLAANRLCGTIRAQFGTESLRRAIRRTPGTHAGDSWDEALRVAAADPTARSRGGLPRDLSDHRHPRIPVGHESGAELRALPDICGAEHRPTAVRNRRIHPAGAEEIRRHRAHPRRGPG